jgi:hypothetical protein
VDRFVENQQLHRGCTARRLGCVAGIPRWARTARVVSKVYRSYGVRRAAGGRLALRDPDWSYERPLRP